MPVSRFNNLLRLTHSAVRPWIKLQETNICGPKDQRYSAVLIIQCSALSFIRRIDTRPFQRTRRNITMTWPVNSPRKWPVTRKKFPFDDVIMISYVEGICQMPFTGTGHEQGKRHFTLRGQLPFFFQFIRVSIFRFKWWCILLQQNVLYKILSVATAS